MAEVVELSIDLDSLTISEIELIEELSGRPFDEMFAAGTPKAKAMRALAFCVKKRENPNFTWEAAGDLIVRFPKRKVDPTGADAS